MSDREVNWFALIPLTLTAGLLSLVLEIARIWPGTTIRPDLVWCVAFFAMRRADAAAVLGAAFAGGLARDLLLGPKLGSAVLAFYLAGLVFIHLREAVAGGGFAEHAVLVGGLAFFVNFLKVFLDQGWDVSRSWSGYFFVALGDGLLTLAAYPFVYLFLSLPGLDPTRERRWSL